MNSGQEDVETSAGQLPRFFGILSTACSLDCLQFQLPGTRLGCKVAFLMAQYVTVTITRYGTESDGTSTVH